MLVVNELVAREARKYDPTHASTVSGKLRVATFTITVPEGTDETQVMIAYLPAGRGRVIPGLSRYATKGITGDVKIGFGAYKDSTLGVGMVDANLDILGSSAAEDDKIKSMGDVATVTGVPYASLDDIKVIITCDGIPAGATISGMLVYALL